VIDSEAITAAVSAIGALATSGLGIYFDLRRKRREGKASGQAKEAAAEAVSDAIEKPPVFIGSVHGHPDSVVASAEEITNLVTQSVGKVVADATKQSTRSAFLSGFFFFIAGVLATIAITLYVHPSK
jgi:hypothetical protein